MKHSKKFGRLMSLTLVMYSIGVLAQSGGGSSVGGDTSALIMPLPMIQSEDALRNYAMSIGKYGSRHVYAESMDWWWSDRLSYTNVIGQYGEDVLDKLFNVEFQYRLTNPADTINGYVYIYDGEWDGVHNPTLLFFGSAQYTQSELETNKPTYGLWMQQVPLPLGNVESAEILALNADGKTADRISLNISDRGQILFSGSSYAGAPNGIMSVRFTDGTLATYDLSSPVGDVPVGSTESAQYKVDGHYIYKVGEKPCTVKIIEPWRRPTAFVDVIWGNTVTFDVVGLVQLNGQTTFERPYAAVIETQDGTSKTLALQGGTTTFKFPTGKYRIRFLWKHFAEPYAIYTGPAEGGKG